MIPDAHSVTAVEQRPRLAVLRILNGSGDTSVSWDPSRLAQADPEAGAAVREAERLFAKARAEGAVAFRINRQAPATKLTDFDRSLGALGTNATSMITYAR
jgi:hypothetical protein